MCWVLGSASVNSFGDCDKWTAGDTGLAADCLKDQTNYEFQERGDGGSSAGRPGVNPNAYDFHNPNPEDVPAAASPGAASDEKQAAKFTPEECKKASEAAIQACQAPLASATGMSTENAEAVGAGATILAQIGPMLSGGSTQQLCEAVRMVGAASALTNGGFGGNCKIKITECSTKCSNPENEEWRVTYNYFLKQCEKKGVEFTAMMQQMGQGALTAKVASACANASSSKVNMPNIGSMQVDCSNPSNASNPYCVNPTLNFQAPTTGYAESGTGAGVTAEDFMGLGDGDPSQLEVTGGAPIGKAAANAVPGGGSSGPLGSQNGLNGGGDEKGGGQGSGYNTDVLNGERGGGGYSSAGGSGGGGWSGYGTGSGNTNTKGSGFDLRQFLPGQNKGAVRGVAALGRAPADIGPMHGDIFQKITDRVKVICSKKVIMGCN